MRLSSVAFLGCRLKLCLITLTHKGLGILSDLARTLVLYS